MPVLICCFHHQPIDRLPGVRMADVTQLAGMGAQADTKPGLIVGKIAGFVFQVNSQLFQHCVGGILGHVSCFLDGAFQSIAKCCA
ncbi:MAG: hypothetical protein WCH07_01250 [Deltaproteobacteria bacterium]